MPAKFIKWRFDEDTIKKLEDIRWFEWNIDEVVAKKDELEGLVNFDMELYRKAVNRRKPDLRVITDLAY